MRKNMSELRDSEGTVAKRLLCGKIASLLMTAVALGNYIAGAHPIEIPKEKEWSALRVGNEIAGEDSWQGFNRAMFGIQDVIMDYVAAPINHVYCSVLPKPVIRGVDNAIDNSEYPIRFVATLLRGEGGCAWDETKRFAANTLGDPARAVPCPAVRAARARA